MPLHAICSHATAGNLRHSTAGNATGSCAIFIKQSQETRERTTLMLPLWVMITIYTSDQCGIKCTGKNKGTSAGTMATVTMVTMQIKFTKLLISILEMNHSMQTMMWMMMMMMMMMTCRWSMKWFRHAAACHVTVTLLWVEEGKADGVGSCTTSRPTSPPGGACVHPQSSPRWVRQLRPHSTHTVPSVLTWSRQFGRRFSLC